MDFWKAACLFIISPVIENIINFKYFFGNNIEMNSEVCHQSQAKYTTILISLHWSQVLYRNYRVVH